MNFMRTDKSYIIYFILPIRVTVIFIYFRLIFQSYFFEKYIIVTYIIFIPNIRTFISCITSKSNRMKKSIQHFLSQRIIVFVKGKKICVNFFIFVEKTLCDVNPLTLYMRIVNILTTTTRNNWTNLFLLAGCNTSYRINRIALHFCLHRSRTSFIWFVS